MTSILVKIHTDHGYIYAIDCTDKINRGFVLSLTTPNYNQTRLNDLSFRYTQ
jgi:hypothetical protein